MPELPEVETVRRGLAETITGRKIADVTTDLPKMLKGKSRAAFATAVIGAKVTGVNRRGKYLLINLSNGLTIIAHLKMTGQLIVNKTSDPVERWTHVILTLSGGRDLRFRDIRQFGYLDVKHTDEIGVIGEKIPGLGPEPLSREFTKGVFEWKLKKRPQSRIKTLLLDQAFIAGLGNIYADEVLHYAGVRPGRRTATLTAKERDQIYNAIRKILPAAIDKRGTSISTFVDVAGRPGAYVPHLKVYGKTGETCARCANGTVKRVVMAGRSAHYCPKCQK